MSPKPSQAKFFTARINPLSDEKQAKVLLIISELEAQGQSFKQIAVDAIYEKHSREIQPIHKGGLSENQILSVITRAIDLVLGKRTLSFTDDSLQAAHVEPATGFAAKLAEGLVNRQPKNSKQNQSNEDW